MVKHSKRLDKISDGIQAMPVTPAAVDAALQRFREQGELPEHQRLAERTIEEALRLPRPRSIREMLLGEAVSLSEPKRLVARTALKLLVEVGQDVTSRNLVDEDMELPQYGSVGLAVLGWPDCFVVPPYEDQARRLIDRHYDLLDRVHPVPRGWWERFASAFLAFSAQGAMPEDELLRGLVLTLSEMHAIVRHLLGEDVRELMAAFDAVARAAGEELEAAKAKLAALVTAP